MSGGTKDASVVSMYSLSCGFVENDGHGAPAEHVGRPHHHREADLPGDDLRLLDAVGDAVTRLAQPELVDQHLEAVAVFGKVDGVGRRAENGHIRGFERLGELQRRLPAELHDNALHMSGRLLSAHDLQHVLCGQRLEIEPVGGS